MIPTVFRFAVRWLSRLAMVLALSMVLAVLCGGCFMPPVVMEAHDPEWALEKSRYPKSSSVVEIEAGDVVLRGLYVPSDPGAPLVVHYAEAGSSITQCPVARDQYLDLANRGFASLAIDYRGVGLSGGEMDTGAVPLDVDAIYAHGLGMVDGDPAQLVLRGTSLGTMAIAHLLAEGHQPAAVVLYAPVFADSVVLAFGYAMFNDFLVTMVRPFLRSVPLPRLTDGLESYVGKIFVMGHPSDELVSDEEFAELARVVEEKGGTLVSTETGMVPFGNNPVLEHLGEHVRLTLRSLAVELEEAEFLAECFPGAPDVEFRIDAAMAKGDPGLVQRVKESVPAMVRLRTLVKVALGEPDHLLAAAERTALPVLLMTLFATEQRFNGRTALTGLSGADVSQLLDFEDPAGEMMLLEFVYTHFQVRQTLGDAAADRVHLRRVLTLCRCMVDHFEGVKTAEDKVDTGPADDPWSCRLEDDVVYWSQGGETQGYAILGDGPGSLSGVDLRRQVARLYCKAAGFNDRVWPAPNQHLVEIVGEGGSWTVDCRTLTICPPAGG